MEVRGTQARRTTTRSPAHEAHDKFQLLKFSKFLEFNFLKPTVLRFSLVVSNTTTQPHMTSNKRNRDGKAPINAEKGRAYDDIVEEEMFDYDQEEEELDISDSDSDSDDNEPVALEEEEDDPDNYTEVCPSPSLPLPLNPSPSLPRYYHLYHAINPPSTSRYLNYLTSQPPY